MALKNNPRKILIINLGGIGDIILSLAAVRALGHTYRDAAVDILVVRRAADQARSSGLFDRVFIYDGNLLERLSLLAKLRGKEYDLAVNMRTMVSRVSAFKMYLLLFLIGARTWAGRDTDGRGDFFEVKIPETLHGDKHESEYDLELVERLGAGVKDRKMHYDVAAADEQKVRTLLREAGIPDDAVIVGIHPGGKPSHRWPGDRFAAVMKAVSGAVKCSFIVTGDRGESVLADEVIRLSGVKAVNMAGALTLGELAAAITRCRVFISNDTAAMHIAAIKGVNLVAIFGPGYLKRFDPRAISPHAAVLYKAAQCAPCDKAQCGSMKCLNDISVKEVAESAMKFLNA